MDYTFNEKCRRWNEAKKQELAEMLATTFNVPITNEGSKPRIEIDGLSKGITLRNIPAKDFRRQAKTIRKADIIYNTIMV